MAWQTLVTDASFDGPGVAGWGAWAKADGFECSTTGAGIVTLVRALSNNDAELAAAVYGLRMAVEYAPGQNVLLQSDSMHVLRVLKHYLGLRDRAHQEGLRVQGDPRKQLPDEQTRLLEMFRAAYQGAGVSVALRHVKGHHRNTNGRHWCNQTCDRNAKLHMQQARELKKRGVEPSEPMAALRVPGLGLPFFAR